MTLEAWYRGIFNSIHIVQLKIGLLEDKLLAICRNYISQSRLCVVYSTARFAVQGLSRFC
jgi:hypothetical protein